MCGCECCISAKSMHLSLLSRREIYMKKIKDQSCNEKNRRSGETANHIFETYKNSVMTHGKHKLKIASEMSMAKICAYPSFRYASTHWNLSLRCCAQCPRIYLPITELDHQNSHVSRTILFHVYPIIEHCTVHCRRPFNENKQCQFFDTSSDSIVTTKLYIIKKLIIMETPIIDFHQHFYILAIKNLALHLPHVNIIGNHHFCNSCREALNNHVAFQDVLCRWDDGEHVVVIFSHKIQSDCYDGNISVSIEGNSLEHWVLHTKKHNHHLCTIASVILFFTLFFRTTENKIQIQQLDASK